MSIVTHYLSLVITISELIVGKTDKFSELILGPVFTMTETTKSQDARVCKLDPHTSTGVKVVAGRIRTADPENTILILTTGPRSGNYWVARP